MSNKFDGENYKDHKPEDELGVAINEFAMDDEFHAKKETQEDENLQDEFAMDDAFHVKKEAQEDENLQDEFAFSAEHKEETEYKYEHDYNEQEQEEAHKYVVAESSKDRFIDKVKGNIVYILIAAIIIIPGIFKLSQFFTTPSTAEQPKAQNITFNEQPARAPGQEQTAAEPKVDEHSQQFEDLLQKEKALIAENQAMMESGQPSTTPEALALQADQEKLQALKDQTLLAAQTDTTIVEPPIEGDRSVTLPNANIGNESTPASATINTINEQPLQAAVPSKTSDEVLGNYFQQESKLGEQLQEVLKRMQSIEKNLIAVEQVEERVGSLEQLKEVTPAQPVNNEKLDQLQTQIAALTQTVQQLNQRVQEQNIVPEVPEAPSVANASVGTAQNAQAPVTGIIVEAVIPGRAWIRNQQGVLMVIEVGDEIPGAGKVTRIDAQEGTVATAAQVFKQ